MTVSAATGGGSTATSNPPDSSGKLQADFKAAAAVPPASLTVQGNTIDTGRYLITGSNEYTRPMDGGKANDGMVKVFDKTNQSWVEVFGDPHVYTSAGDRANFQADGLTLNLADGTQIQFKPTVETNGVSHLDAIAVTENGQTVVQSGYFADKGGAHVTTGSIQAGGASSAQGFNDVRDTVLSVGSAGSLGTLVNSFGSQLSSKGFEDSLDGMGGGYGAFGSSSGTTAMQAYSKAVDSHAGSGDSPQAAEEPAQRAAIVPAAKDVAPAGADVTAILQQLLGLLQPTSSAPAPTSAPAPAVAATTQAQAASPSATSLSSIVALLQKNSAAGTLSPQQAALVQQLLPLLQQQSGPLPASEAPLLAQLAAALQPGTAPTTAAEEATPVATNPSRGVGGDEIAAMQADANGTGPAVQFSTYDKAAAAYDKAAGADPNAATPAPQQASMGIGAAEIQAMLAEANGTGPAVNFADYHTQDVG